MSPPTCLKELVSPLPQSLFQSQGSRLGLTVAGAVPRHPIEIAVYCTSACTRPRRPRRLVRWYAGAGLMMTDAMLMAYLAQPLSRCPAREAKATLKVAVSATGQGMLNQAIGVDALCAGDVINIYPFIGTGVDRVLSQEYDFSKPLKPDWLNAPVCREQRVAAASPEAPKPDATDPATQAPAEPQPQSAAAGGPAEPIAPPPPPPAAAPAPSPPPAASP